MRVGVARLRSVAFILVSFYIAGPHSAAENATNAAAIPNIAAVPDSFKEQSISPSPASTSTVEPIMDITVIKNRLLNSKTLRRVDLYLKLNLFQIMGRRSSITFLPDFGVLCASRVTGLFCAVFMPVK